MRTGPEDGPACASDQPDLPGEQPPADDVIGVLPKTALDGLLVADSRLDGPAPLAVRAL